MLRISYMSVCAKFLLQMRVWSKMCDFLFRGGPELEKQEVNPPWNASTGYINSFLQHSSSMSLFGSERVNVGEMFVFDSKRIHHCGVNPLEGNRITVELRMFYQTQWYSDIYSTKARIRWNNFWKSEISPMPYVRDFFLIFFVEVAWFHNTSAEHSNLAVFTSKWASFPRSYIILCIFEEVCRPMSM